MTVGIWRWNDCADNEQSTRSCHHTTYIPPRENGKEKTNISYGVGVTKTISSVLLWSEIFSIVKTHVSLEYRVHIWQVSPQLTRVIVPAWFIKHPSIYQLLLIHCGLVTPYGDIKLDQHFTPLPESMLTNHQWGLHLEFTRGQFHGTCSNIYPWHEFEYDWLNITAAFPREQWVGVYLAAWSL